MTWTHPPPTEESTSFHREPRFHSQPRPQMAAQDVAPRPPQAQPRFPPVRTGPPPRPSTLPALHALAPWGKSTHSTAKLPSALSAPTPTLHPEAMVPVGAAAHGGLTSDQMAQPRPPLETQTPRAQPGTLLPRPGRFSLPLSPWPDLCVLPSTLPAPLCGHRAPGPPRTTQRRPSPGVPHPLLGRRAHRAALCRRRSLQTCARHTQTRDGSSVSCNGRARGCPLCSPAGGFVPGLTPEPAFWACLRAAQRGF